MVSTNIFCTEKCFLIFDLLFSPIYFKYSESLSKKLAQAHTPSTSSFSNKNPSTLCSIISLNPPTLLAKTGVPYDIDSKTHIGIPSVSEGIYNKSDIW